MARKKKEQPVKATELTYQNYGFIPVEYVGITLYDLKDHFQAALLFHSRIENEQTLEAHHHELPIAASKDEVLRTCIMGIVTLYGEEVLLDQVTVFNEEGKLVDEISLSSYNFGAPPSAKSKKLVTRGA